MYNEDNHEWHGKAGGSQCFTEIQNLRSLNFWLQYLDDFLSSLPNKTKNVLPSISSLLSPPSPPKSNNRSLHRSHFKPSPSTTNTARPHHHRRTLSPSPPTHNHHRRSPMICHQTRAHKKQKSKVLPWHLRALDMLGKTLCDIVTVVWGHLWGPPELQQTLVEDFGVCYLWTKFMFFLSINVNFG